MDDSSDPLSQLRQVVPRQLEIKALRKPLLWRQNNDVFAQDKADRPHCCPRCGSSNACLPVKPARLASGSPLSDPAVKLLVGGVAYAYAARTDMVSATFYFCSACRRN